MAKVKPNKNPGRKKNESRNESGRHSPAHHIRTHPWQKDIWRLGPEWCNELKGLLTKNPAGMESDGDKQRTGLKCGVSENKPSEEKRKKTPAQQWPWRRAGKGQRQLFESAEPPHWNLESLTRGAHEMNQGEERR